ncbi:toxin-antitoxin system, toxin component [Streptomyces sp. NPDC059650]|uniref:toxin-antitoxin system, toxin component n=1 Tax=Streptomyces sp. NPDC059650 TaxID=3346896 RepID=UPI0036AA8037
MIKSGIRRLRSALGGSKSDMVKLRNEVLENLDRPIPSDPEGLFESLRSYLEQQVGMPVELIFKEFPEGTASGLTLSLPGRRIIVVEENTGSLHKLVILAHEMWHCLRGGCHGHGSHPSEVAAAARSLSGELKESDIVALAARTSFDTREENDAETFGLLMGSSFRAFLEEPPDPALGEGLAGRIQASLGHRGS